MRTMRLNLMTVLGMTLSLVAFSAAAAAANAPDTTMLTYRFACDFYHPQDCNVNAPPPSLSISPTI